MAHLAVSSVMEAEPYASVEMALEVSTDDEFVEANMRRVFVKALSRRSQLKDPKKAAHWLGRIAVNTALDFVRKRKRVTFEELDKAPEISTETPEESLLRGEKRSYIEDGLRLLSERERAALILRDIEGLPAAEVALQLNCSPATVRSHIANARVKFRKYVKGRKR
jgi:RNA polymerase sigma-70 factor (ECF subfamily)